MPGRQPPADDEVMIECPLCGEALTYGAARAATIYPVAADENEGPGALRGVARLSCRCGRTSVDIQLRGDMRIVVPRPGETLGSSSGPDASVVI